MSDPRNPRPRPRIEFERRAVSIVELTGSRWAVTPDGGIHDSAREALDYVRAMDARRVDETGISCATTVEWTPRTVRGRRAVLALGSGS